MFVGWFKIEGHSNPKPRRGFERLNNALKIKQILGKGILKSEKNYSLQIFSERKFRLTIKVFFAILVLLGIICLSLLFNNSSKSKNSVIYHMEQRQIQLTGSNEFISPTEKLLREAEAHNKSGNYNKAYLSFKEAYKLGTTNKKVYLGLLETSKKLCEDDQKYCEEILEWKKIIDRLK